MAAYPGHSLVSIFNLRPEVGLVRFADGSRYAGEAYRQRLVTSADPACWGYVQPRCTCGWAGKPEWSEMDAQATRELHALTHAPRDAAASGGESLDEYERRCM